MTEKTIRIIGIVVPDESLLFLAVVAVHVLIALAAVVAGIAAMLVSKGVGRHSRFGVTYLEACELAHLTVEVQLRSAPSPRDNGMTTAENLPEDPSASWLGARFRCSAVIA